MAVALSAADSAVVKQGALDDLQTDMHAASSISSRASTLRTWIRFHKEWFGDDVDEFPFTETSLRAVAAMFKKGSYRSGGDAVGHR